ncbi:MAG: aldehyde ferredoxin oxidoreductase family protein [Bacteroidales bacterium]|nr:aldehyde ferredoxin oxidoreductase family protein [Bacteroidales bacterium]
MKTIKGGYHNKLLRINLNEHSTNIETIPEEILLNYIGGRGLGSKFLFDEVPAKTDPLGKDNKLLFVTGPMHGSNAPTSSRFSVVSKSPLTGAITSTNSGGHFGVDLKNTGFDVVIFEGISENPCYVFINGQNVEIRDAKKLWGKNTHETTDMLLSEIDAKAGVACIGPSGEKCVLIASIINDKGHSSGRTGVGAVMGSKNLKAIVVVGDKKTPYHDEENIKNARKEWQTFIGEAPLTKNALKEYGTPTLVHVINNRGGFATKNFQEGYFANADSISGETLKELYHVRSQPCKSCPIGCAHLTATPERNGKGPEFETLWSFGAACCVNDLEKIIHANYNCNELGIDTISAGSTIACAMELSEKGYLDNEAIEQIRKDIGRDLKFGDADAIVKLTELMGKSEGFGKILGMGSKRLAEKYGHPELAMHVKGLELPAYDPRAFYGMSLSLATNNRGGCHLRAYLISTEAAATPFEINRFSKDGKSGLTKLYQDLTATIDSMGVCLFTNFALNPIHYANMVSAVTGVKIDSKELLLIGERIWNIEKLFNLREGLTRNDDTLPPRLLNEPLKSGHSKGITIDIGPLLDEFYKLRGWSKEGIPSEEKLKELNLLEEGKSFLY